MALAGIKYWLTTDLVPLQVHLIGLITRHTDSDKFGPKAASLGLCTWVGVVVLEVSSHDALLSTEPMSVLMRERERRKWTLVEISAQHCTHVQCIYMYMYMYMYM